jgi:hypothetical protein
MKLAIRKDKSFEAYVVDRIRKALDIPANL